MTVRDFLRVVDRTLWNIIITNNGDRISGWSGSECRSHAKGIYGDCLVKRVSVTPNFGMIIEVILD